ncbi:serine-rich coiled-coil domain-containing protein 2 isoform X2 [Spea bombifrons]|uniref:serine-rich coiled-coil domain-containing protein 2 isoform X2 n=1 Tax=Spea bombifrons TaxID=233779 RepID=UPI002349F786|nr:serine-rich coiled-coil domain-containing protein 2 isoform X2 [Spea bombifrons]
MEEKIQVRGSPGSKLPKFNGAKPLGSFLQRTPNGAHLALSGKPGFPKAERHDVEFALNWAKQKPPHNEQKDRPVFDKRIPLSHAPDRDGPRFGGPAKVAGKQSNLLASNKEDLNENLLPNAAKFTRGPFLGRTSYSALNGCKTQANGFYSGKPPVGLQRPRANSATSRNFTGRATANSADHPRSFSHVRRSQSFSHSIQNSLLPPGPLTRSYSFNREADLTRPYETQQVPVRAAPKPNLLSRTSKQYDVPNDNEPPGKSSFTRAFPARPHPGLKNAAVANGSAMAFPLGYQMSRPSLLKPNRKQFPREIIIDGTRSSSVAPVTERTERGGPTGEHRPEKKDLDVGGYLLCDNIEKEYSKDECFGDDLDDLSISSLSSSDRNDLSEDFADDFIELDDGNKTVIVVQESGNRVTEKADGDEYSMSSFQDNKKSTVPKGHNWLEQSETESTNSPYGETPVSPDMEYRDPSSLELSPSDSSDGTYMWDEEGMEPIGSVHPCGSYESSEMNSLDILNNLDSCDLEDDDLMLDVDLPEDAQGDLGSETMSLLERSERKVRLQQQGLWKRPPQRLGGQEPYYPLNAERYHNGRGSAYLESPTDRENYSKFCPPSPRGPQPMGFRETTVMLDEMTLRHMVQDCTAVKTQLLKLKRLLQQEDDAGSLPDLQLSFPPTPEPQDPGTLWKSEELLLNEIRQLKEDAKKKDDKIQRLEEQLKAGCKCQKGGQEAKSEKPKQHDKYTQTSCRRSSSGYCTPSFSPSWQGNPRTGPAHRRQTSSTTAFHQQPRFHRPPFGKINDTPAYRGPK